MGLVLGVFFSGRESPFTCILAISAAHLFAVNGNCILKGNPCSGKMLKSFCDGKGAQHTQNASVGPVTYNITYTIQCKGALCLSHRIYGGTT